jgi:acyl-coenzyme A synthetase/AMP-(fatty) acid ligase
VHAELPLINGFAPAAAVGWSDGGPVSAARFCAAARVLAAELPRRRYAINLCEDRLNFMLGFAAALIARQVSLLPYTKAPGAIRELCMAHADSYCISDGSDLPAGVPAIMAPPWRAFDAAAEAPTIPADCEALVAFTSGSTGRPQAHCKTWGSLVSDARSLFRDLGVDGSGAGAIVGTVPPQHVYGLETTVMLPLQNGLASHSAMPLLPADITAALTRGGERCWLATTPLHLQACVAENADLPNLAGIVCATMPLSAELARDAEKRWAAPVQEIYGCTEAGAVAVRRPAFAARWRARPGIALQRRDRDVWVAGGHLPHPMKLPDRIELVSDTEFKLLGRPDDMVKIAGKRVSLEALNRELQRVPGVRDGVFFIPEDCPPGRPRLAALAVAPGCDGSAIRRALRERIDAVFLPRPLLIVDALPRGTMGKIPREGLHTLAAAAKGRRSRRSA